ncbi:MAG: sulfatase-like hydrolase/transferase [Actinobacteria bacterium]|nr:sulfatase-like hydrolase/transferase [Actinomycetota bacterium]
MRAEADTAGSLSALRAARGDLHELFFAGLHLFVLWALAVAQPLFDVLSDSPEFFVVRGSTRWDVIAFALGLILLPPALLLAIEALAGLAGARARDVVHLAFVATLAGVIALQAVKRIVEEPAALLIVVAAVVGIAAMLAYRRLSVMRTFLSVLGPVPLLFAGLFLLASPVSKIAFGNAEVATAAVPKSADRPPIVFVVFDELPISSLMHERGGIDADRYPNFARLAGDSTWFQNATTVHEHSTEAVPSILTGNYPEDGRLPFAADHPKNLFTLLAGAYDFEVFESATRLCPTSLCPRNEGSLLSRMRWLNSDLSIVYLHVLLPEALAKDLPPVTQTWMNFGGGGQTEGKEARERFERDIDVLVGHELSKDQKLHFEAFVSSIEPSRKPELDFVHVMLPHSPWWHLLSGKRYSDYAGIRGVRDDRWSKDEWFVQQGFQRHLVETAFVDRLLGELFERLDATGRYDRSVIVLVADHGVSFIPGERRRGATEENLHDVALVPLFVKAPGQKEGKVVEDHVQTIDIVPSLADLIGVSLPWKVDGRSFFDPSFRPDPEVHVFRRAGESVIEEPLANLLPRREQTHRQMLALFDTGRTGDLYSIGPHPELIGRTTDDLAPVASDRNLGLDGEDRLDSVELDSSFVPAEITGWIDGDDSRNLDIAVAVNGRIAAVTRTFQNSGKLRFAALAPEAAFRDGANEVEVFVVSSQGTRLRLERLGR